MTGTQLIALYRTLAKDNADPPLCEDEEVLVYLNEAEREASVRKPLLFDNSTESVCTIGITADTATYDIHSSINEITYAAFLDENGLGSELKNLDRVELDRTVTGWRDITETPLYFILDDKSIQLVGNPTDDGALSLEVFRGPLADFTEETSPEIAESHHMHLVDWALYRGFNKPDADQFSPQSAGHHLARFEGYFGLSVDADRKRNGWQNTPHRTKIW